MPNLFNNKALPGSEYRYNIENSLRFNASQSSYLSKTFTTPTDNKKWTYSCWMKRGILSTGPYSIFGQYTDASNRADLYFDAADNLNFYNFISGSVAPNPQWITSQVFRDSAAWYHIMLVWDSNNATAGDRQIIYVNGTRVTSYSQGGTVSLGQASQINTATGHNIGRFQSVSSYFDGYLTEINFIDGQALDPTYFGDYNPTTGVWQPRPYGGTYGTNGFYLPMRADRISEGFNTVTYIGAGSKQQISGVGFSPDLVWMKSRTSATDNHYLVNSVSGVQKALFSNLTNAEATDSTGLLSFDADGFTIGTQAQINTNTVSHVAWCWDAGSSTVSNTDGSITSSVRANPTYGFSIVTYTGTGANATVGHGLGVAPSMVIVKNRPFGGSWGVYHTSIGATNRLLLNGTNASTADSGFWNNTASTSTVFSIGSDGAVNRSGDSNVAYCFAEISGYSKFGSYTGTGASGNTVTTGFKPAMVMVKRTDGAGDWAIFDSTRNASNKNGARLWANLSSSEGIGDLAYYFTDTGFVLNDSDGTRNASGGSYIYMAFKDTRDFGFWWDKSGNENNWQPNGGITSQSAVFDVPTLTSDLSSNYATLNPLDKGTGATLSDANLKVTTTSGSPSSIVRATTPIRTKAYCEFTILSQSGAGTAWGPIVINSDITVPLSDVLSGVYQILYISSGIVYKPASNSGYPTFTTGDIISIAYDPDTKYVWFAKNNTWITGDPSTGTGGFISTDLTNFGTTQTFGWYDGTTSSTQTVTANFGQRPFAYTPPTGFKALNTYNLPDSTIADGSDYFNTVLYTGNGSSNHSITGVGFQPDFTWLKGRSTTGVHGLWDAVRGATKYLVSNNTDAQVTDTTNGLQTFQSDGFTLGSVGTWNTSSASYVAWNWKANGTGVTNTDGSITSTVSANPTAGFSIVTYTGTGANATVGHGLGVAPSMVIVKGRLINYGGGIGGDWIVWHKTFSTVERIYLNYTLAKENGQATTWNSTLPSASVVSLGNNLHVNYDSSSTYVMYCFAEVEGFSKIGKYTGNGSADGTFVYTGFRPQWVMFKRTDSTSNWVIFDTSRDPNNVMIKRIYPDTNESEGVSGNIVDYLSNGFKFRSANYNITNATYIYIAFAENPFKYSLAR